MYHNSAILRTKANMIKEIQIKVEEISCTGCAEDMEIVLRNQDGILDVTVNYADDIIDIKYDSELIKGPTVIHAVERVANIHKVNWR